jgi:hypothetical protein
MYYTIALEAKPIRWQANAIRKFPHSYCCNCLHERKWEGRPRSHFCKPIAICLPRDTALWTRTVFTRVLSQFRVSFCLWWLAKSSNMSESSFARSSVNLLLEALKCFMRLLVNSSFRMTFTFQGCFNWIQLSQHIFFDLVQELFDTHHKI